VQQSNGPRDRVHQIYRDTVGDGHGEEYARAVGDVPVQAFELDPTGRVAVSHDRGAMHLSAEDGGVEAGFGVPESPPPLHHLSDRCIGPQAQIESPSGLGTAPGDPGDHPEPLPPAGDLEAGNGRRERSLADGGHRRESKIED
jgi:hypothetical protein